MSIFSLKVIAVIFMIVDHIKYALLNCINEFTIYFGRISFPLFAFCIVQGYIYTTNFEKYIKRLLIAGAISEIPFLLFNSLPLLQNVGFNIMFTFALGLITIKAYETYEEKFKRFLILIISSILAIGLNFDYGCFGIFLIFSFYIFKECKWKTLFVSSFVVSLKYLYRIVILNLGFNEYTIKCWIFTMIPLFLILFYNKKQGPKIKWFFYIVYPIHLLILYILYNMLY